MPLFAGLLLALACSPADRDVPAPPLLVDTIPGISGSFIVIPDSPSCADCKIELVKVATIGESEPPGALTGQARVAPAADGRYYVSDGSVAPGKVLVFDSAGNYLTVFGRPGEGPGEFGGPRTVISRGPDAIQVADRFLRRVTTFTSPDYKVVRIDGSIPLPIRSYAVLPDGAIVVNAVLRTRDGIGYPLHLLDGSFQLVRSFGSHAPSLLPDRAYLNERAVAAGHGDSIWSARETRFVVELWNREGTFLGGYVRDASWFEPWDVFVNAMQWVRPPQPKIAAIHQDDVGRLWLAAAVADANWQPDEGPPRNPRLPGELAHVPELYHKYYDTIIEVWDIEHARVLASVRSGLRTFPIPATNLLYSKHEDQRGNYYLDIWRPTITTQGR